MMEESKLTGWLSLVPCFNGMDDVSIYQLIDKTNMIKELAKWDDKQTAIYVKLRLGGGAAEFIQAFGSMYDTWDKLKEALTQQYGDRASRIELEKQLVFSMQNEGESAADFMARLLLISNKLKDCYSRENLFGSCFNTEVIRERVLHQFLGGLNKDIRRFVLVRSPDNLEKALEIAQREESVRDPSSIFKGIEKKITNKNPPPIVVPRTSRCYACRRKGHLIASCPFKSPLQ
jgi:hypothetical protein